MPPLPAPLTPIVYDGLLRAMSIGFSFPLSRPGDSPDDSPYWFESDDLPSMPEWGEHFAPGPLAEFTPADLIITPGTLDGLCDCLGIPRTY